MPRRPAGMFSGDRSRAAHAGLLDSGGRGPVRRPGARRPGGRASAPSRRAPDPSADRRPLRRRLSHRRVERGGRRRARDRVRWCSPPSSWSWRGSRSPGAATQVPLWVLALALAAPGIGLGNTGSLGLLVEAVPVDRIVTAMVVWSQIGIIGYMLGPLAGGIVAEGPATGTFGSSRPLRARSCWCCFARSRPPRAVEGLAPSSTRSRTLRSWRKTRPRRTANSLAFMPRQASRSTRSPDFATRRNTQAVSLHSSEPRLESFTPRPEPDRPHRSAAKRSAGSRGRDRAPARAASADELELNDLRAVRNALTPPELSSQPGVDLAASFLPATEGVSGDFYLVGQGPNDATALIVGDVVGKGLPAARRAAFIRTVFATTAPFSDDPGQFSAGRTPPHRAR